MALAVLTHCVMAEIFGVARLTAGFLFGSLPAVSSLRSSLKVSNLFYIPSRALAYRSFLTLTPKPPLLTPLHSLARSATTVLAQFFLFATVFITSDLVSLLSFKIV